MGYVFVGFGSVFIHNLLQDHFHQGGEFPNSPHRLKDYLTSFLCYLRLRYLDLFLPFCCMYNSQTL